MIKDFEYFAPKTVEEALTLLSQYKEENKVIAGGQSLLILMRQRLVAPRYLIDVKGISSLDYMHLDAKKDLKIGALTSHRTIETSQVTRNGCSVLAEMEKNLASVQTRSWGTIGGNLCHGDPAGDPAPVLIALNGKVTISSLKGERTIAVEDFFTDYFETVLMPDEMLTEIQVPNPSPNTGTAYTKFTKRVGDMAIVGVAVSITLSSKNSTCEDSRIVLGAVASVPMRAKGAEKVLAGKEFTDELLEEAARVASEETKPTSDIHASEGYRRELVKVLVKQVAKEAMRRSKKA